MYNQNQRTSSIIVVILVLILAGSALISIAPSVKAVSNVKTYAFLSLNPNPISMGELTVVNAWLQPIPPTGSDVFHVHRYYHKA